MKPAPTCTGPLRISRRRMLQAGAAGLLGLSLPRLLAAETQGGGKAAADSCILIFLNGGPSHIDMWDMKPNAPAEVKGEFKQIASTAPGIQVCEHLPRLAKQLHHAALVRSVHHSVNNAHAAAVYAALTGHDRGEIGGGTRPTDYPAIGSVLAQQRPPQSAVVPFASMPFITKEGAGGPPQPGFFGGWLGRTHDPLFILRDPNAPNFALPELSLAPDVPLDRLDERRRLLDSIGGNAGNEKVQELAGFRDKAVALLTSPETRKAFQIDQEPAAVRDAYGRNVYGQSVLLARRLVEAGTRLACVSWAPDANATWDTHGNNFGKLKSELLPQLDRAVGSLIGDLAERGRLERTLVVVMGEFGRTPQVKNGGGRDHWNFCYSLMLAGGGIRGGYVHGASDKIGGRPSSNPVTPADIVATIYHCLGIPADLEMHDRLRRPYQLVPWGNPIRELLA